MEKYLVLTNCHYSLYGFPLTSISYVMLFGSHDSFLYSLKKYLTVASPWSRWRDYTATVIVIGGVSYGLYYLIKVGLLLVFLCLVSPMVYYVHLDCSSMISLCDHESI